MPENFAVINLKFKQRGQTGRVFCQKDANGIESSEDPDQTATQEQSDLELHCLPISISPKIRIITVF